MTTSERVGVCAVWCVDHDAVPEREMGVAGWTHCHGEPVSLTTIAGRGGLSRSSDATLTRERWGSNDPADPEPDNFDGYVMEVGCGEEWQLTRQDLRNLVAALQTVIEKDTKSDNQM